MAGRYDIVPLDTSTRTKMYGQLDELSNRILSEADIDRLMGRYSTIEDDALNQQWNAAQMDLTNQFSPAMEAVRRRRMGFGMDNRGLRRDQANLYGDAMREFASRRMQLGGQSAARRAGLFRALSDFRLGTRANLGGALYGRMLSTQKKPTTGQQIAGAGLQVAGGVAGALLGGPPGAAVGASAGQVMNQKLSPENVAAEEQSALYDLARRQPKYRSWGY